MTRTAERGPGSSATMRALSRFGGTIRRHRVLAAFAAGAGLTLAALAVVGYLVLSDQRRAARVLAAALSRALAREVRIDRVVEIGPGRVVLRGLRLSREAGWPADVSAPEAEASGPLLAAARGEPAPVRVVVTRPTVQVPAGGGGGLAALDMGGAALAAFLGSAPLLDVSVTAGGLHAGGARVEFDLVLRKSVGTARAELTFRGAGGPPLALVLDARPEGSAVHLLASGQGSLAPLAGWLPASTPPALSAAPLELALDGTLPETGASTLRGKASLGDLLTTEGEARWEAGALLVTLPRLSADLGAAAAVGGLAWRPSGRAELGDVVLDWPAGGATPSRVSAVARVPRLALPAAGVGTDVLAEEVEAGVTLQPAAGGWIASGEAAARRIQAAGLDATGSRTGYRAVVTGGHLARVELSSLASRVAEVPVRGTARYDASARRLDADLGGDRVDATALVRRLLPGWLADGDRVRAGRLRLVATGVDPAGLRAGRVDLDLGELALARTDGALSAGRARTAVTLGPAGISLALDAERVESQLPVLAGELPRVTATGELSAPGAGGVALRRARIEAVNRGGQRLVTVALAPPSRVGPGGERLLLQVEAPALERLEGLWPAVPRRVKGTARFEGEIAGLDPGTLTGRLVARLDEAEVLDGRVFLRDLAAEVPVHRAEAASAAPWGKIEVNELIASGVVVRDLAAPARLLGDRLTLNPLGYALYSGSGAGWLEVEGGTGGLAARGQLTGEGVRVEEFVAAYGIRGGTMTGLLRYQLDVQYQAGRLGVSGRLEVPEGGTVNIELLNRLLAYAGSDPTGVLRSALENLRNFDYKSAEADVRSAADDIRVTVVLRGRERFGIFPPRVREINVRNMPLGFLARQFPGR